MSYIDAEFPEDIRQLDTNGHPIIGCKALPARHALLQFAHSPWIVCRWMHGFTRAVYAPLTEVLLSAIPPKYETILEMDRLVREHAVPSHLCQLLDEDNFQSVKDNFQGMLACLCRAVGQFFLTLTPQPPQTNSLCAVLLQLVSELW